MENISVQCEEDIRCFSSLMNEAIKQVAIAKKDAIKYQQQLSMLKITNNEKLRKAYALGFKAGQESTKDDVSGGVSKEENTKLVLKQD